MQYSLLIGNVTKKGISDRIKSLFDSQAGKVNAILHNLNIPEPTFYRSLKTNNWKLEHIAGMAKYFNTSIDFIVFGKEQTVGQTEQLNQQIAKLKEDNEMYRKWLIQILKEKNGRLFKRVTKKR